MPNARSFDRYLLNGKDLTKDEAAAYPIRAAGEGLPDENVVHVLESEESFTKLMHGSKHGERVASMLANMELARKQKDNDRGAQKRQQKLVHRVQEDLEELAKETGLAMSSKEFHDKASAHSLLAPPIFQSGFLWDAAGGHGNAIPTFGVPYPDLNWFGWGNRAMSVTVNGTMVVCDGTWYSGPQFWFFGFFWPTFDLGTFVRRVESVYGT